jgi:hypothetical protein
MRNLLATVRRTLCLLASFPVLGCHQSPVRQSSLQKLGISVGSLPAADRPAVRAVVRRLLQLRTDSLPVCLGVRDSLHRYVLEDDFVRTLGPQTHSEAECLGLGPEITVDSVARPSPHDRVRYRRFDIYLFRDGTSPLKRLHANVWEFTHVNMYECDVSLTPGPIATCRFTGDGWS